MKRLLLILILLIVSFYCFAQQNLPGKIIGKVPDMNSAKTYQIQIGAYKHEANIENAVIQLRKNALIPESEKYFDFTRVMIKRIPADQVINFLAVLKRAGFNEVIIREDVRASTTAAAVPAAAEIPAPNPLFRSWKVVNSSDAMYSDCLLTISNEGIFHYTAPDGYLDGQGQWRWYNENASEFEYSHDGWESIGKVKILSLGSNSLKLLEPGITDNYWELAPVSQ